MALPQSAADAGNNLHNNFLATIRNLPSLVAQAAAQAVPGGQAIAAAPAAVTALAPPTMDFIHGLMTGHAAASAPQMQARVATAAPKAAAPAKPAGNPNAGQTVTLGNGMTVTMPSAAWLKANAATAAPQGQVSDSGGGAQPAAATASDSRPATAFDFVRQAAMANPNLTIGQLGTVADAASRLIPQKALVPKDQVIAQYSDLANRYAAMVAQDPNYAKTAAGQAHYNLIQNLRSVVTPNPMFDVANMGLYNQEPGQAQ